jgi:protein-tyrosine-phosphatase
MAEAVARHDAADVIDPSSVGLAPLGYIADLTRRTLIKNGYGADGLTSDAITREAVEAADLVINMTGRRLGKLLQAEEKVKDWIVEDPFDADPETYQRVFDEIRQRVNQLALGLREKRKRKNKTEAR